MHAMQYEITLADDTLIHDNIAADQGVAAWQTRSISTYGCRAVTDRA